MTNTKHSRSDLPVVALVGRTNVGKSTLFNRLVGEKKAVESKVPNTTRDVNEGVCTWRGLSFSVVDTGGFIEKPREEIDSLVTRYARKAIGRASVILFVVDVREGLNPDDRAYLRSIRTASKAPIVVIANKADGTKGIARASDHEWLTLGAGDAYPVSAVSGRGVGDLLDHLCSLISFQELPTHHTSIRVAIVGRANVGKSSLLNRIVGEERVIVSPVAHTTREPQDTHLMRDDVEYVIVDTVGIRKKARVKSQLEREGLTRSVETIKKGDVVILVLDATVTPSKQESRLAELAVESGSGLVIVVNKWDCVAEKQSKSVLAYEAFYYRHLSFVPWAPILFVSALTGQRTGKILDIVAAVNRERNKLLSQDDLTLFLKKCLSKQKPIWILGKKKPVVYGFRQASASPPTFFLQVRESPTIQYAYLRYLENRLREQHGFSGTAIRVFTEQVLAKDV